MSARIPGLTIASLKKNYHLVPLFGIVGFASLLAITRLTKASLASDVMWNKSQNPEPWQEVKNKNILPERPSLDNNRYKGI